MQRFFATLLLSCSTLVLVQPSWAEEEDKVSVEEQWKQAKQDYRESLDAIKKDVIERVQLAEEKARERGDAERVRLMKAALVAFEENSELPSVINKLDHAVKLRKAESDLKKVFKEVQTTYLKERRDDESEELEQDLIHLLNPPSKNGDLKSTIGDSAETQKSSRKLIALPGARWMNTSYDNTLVQGKGNEWMDVSNKTGKVLLRYTEVARTKDYLELYCAERNHRVRFMAKRADLYQSGKWSWVATGYWVGAAGE